MFTRIDLHQFKCFDLLRLPLASLTLLTGLNASGKSSVLQAFALLNQTMREHEWSTRLVLNGKIVRLGATPDVVDEENSKNTFSIGLETDEKVLKWDFYGERHDRSMAVESVYIGGRKIKHPQTLHYLLPADEDPPIHLANHLRDMTYITAERIPPQETYLLEDSHIINVVGPRGEHTLSILHWGEDKSVQKELVISDSPPLLMRQVEERMRTLFPGFRINLQTVGNSLILGLRISDTTGFHNPIHTGFGLTQILPIIVAILAADRGDIIMIENPEIHLHPAGQALVGQFMADAARAGIQLLVETHSDHVLNGVRRAIKDSRISADQVAIHFFRPRSEGLTQVLSPIIDDSGNIDYWPDGFFDQFDKDSNYFAGWGLL